LLGYLLDWIALPCRVIVFSTRLAAFAVGLAWRRRRARALFVRRLRSLGIEPAARAALAGSFDALPSLQSLLRNGMVRPARRRCGSAEEP
jgi:hypothetical protein